MNAINSSRSLGFNSLNIPALFIEESWSWFMIPISVPELLFPMCLKACRIIVLNGIIGSRSPLNKVKHYKILPMFLDHF